MRVISVQDVVTSMLVGVISVLVKVTGVSNKSAFKSHKCTGFSDECIVSFSNKCIGCRDVVMSA